ncbi:hypothetical protein HID58_039175 [Brassica napus]|uniref:Protein kinase domain-containing protein n=1 Tax=Brassica napus TaxID=3708 RepID=A0ABQ8BRG9_BRANA|nr:hypothetical protein HID58_039175 [Brassica napus]
MSEKKFPLNAKDYKLQEEIGDGVSATVHKALCIPLNEVVAIKVLDLEKCNNDLDGIRREVQTMSLINHPNVLQAHCSFTAGHQLWVVMPYMAGGSCLHIIKSSYQDGFEEPVIATLLRETLRALVYLHAHGHIHRDVKAGNILLDSNGVVKLADFGVSACMFDTGDRQRSRNTFVGTPCWMAPEVMQQLHGYDFKADVWSFGITALELAHGHAPFSKYPPMKVLLMTLQNAPPGLDYERDKRFSKAFKEMVGTCLVKDPKKRPTSEKLLKHPFFKQARPPDYLAKTILNGLPPLGERYRTIKSKEADLLMQNKSEYEAHLSQASIRKQKFPLSVEIILLPISLQQEYIRGISAWNFNLEDLKSQAALISDDDSSHAEEPDFNRKQCERQDESALSPERASSSETTPSQDVLFETILYTFKFDPLPHDVNSTCISLSSSSFQDELNDIQDLESSFASFPIKPLQALKEFQLRRYQSERSYSGSLQRTKRDTVDEMSDSPHVEHKGRFKVTSADLSPKGSTNSTFTPFSSGGSSSPSSLTTASILPSVQSMLQHNTMQREEILRVLKHLEQTSVKQQPGSPETSVDELLQMTPATARERELQTQLMLMQQRRSKEIEAEKWAGRESVKRINAEKRLSLVKS